MEAKMDSTKYLTCFWMRVIISSLKIPLTGKWISERWELILWSSGALAALFPFGVNLVGIPTDESGMDPDALEKLLTTWDFKAKPLKAMYMIPTGQNPSGASLTLERKKKIYQLASKYNLIILGRVQLTWSWILKHFCKKRMTPTLTCNCPNPGVML